MGKQLGGKNKQIATDERQATQQSEHSVEAKAFKFLRGIHGIWMELEDVGTHGKGLVIQY